MGFFLFFFLFALALILVFALPILIIVSVAGLLYLLFKLPKGVGVALALLTGCYGRIHGSVSFAYRVVSTAVLDLVDDIRFGYKVARQVHQFLGLMGSLQEIREIVVRVERGEWWPELGDPFDHVKYEASRGISNARSLLGDRRCVVEG